MVFPLQPVLVHLLVDVDDVTLLQGQLPGGQSKDSSKLRSSPSSFFSEPVQNTQSPLHPLGMPTSAVCPSPRVQSQPQGAGVGREGHLLGGLCLEVKLEPSSLPLCRGRGHRGRPGSSSPQDPPQTLSAP